MITIAAVMYALSLVAEQYDAHFMLIFSPVNVLSSGIMLNWLSATVAPHSAELCTSQLGSSQLFLLSLLKEHFLLPLTKLLLT